MSSPYRKLELVSAQPTSIEELLEQARAHLARAEQLATERRAAYLEALSQLTRAEDAHNAAYLAVVAANMTKKAP